MKTVTVGGKKMMIMTKAEHDRKFKVGRKGSMSKTRPGEKNFTTKKTSLDFDRDGRRSRRPASGGRARRPYSTRRRRMM